LVQPRVKAKLVISEQGVAEFGGRLMARPSTKSFMLIGSCRRDTM
jgi:hypothetical protein